MVRPCQSSLLYHYLLGSTEGLASICERGLLPLSAMPESEEWKQKEPFYRELYRRFAEPLLRRPFFTSGLFLTPIDFRQIPDSLLAKRPRIAIPLSALSGSASILTYELDGQRILVPCTQEALDRAAATWDEERISTWFGRDPQQIFFYVPQVAVFTEQGIPIDPAWIET